MDEWFNFGTIRVFWWMNGVVVSGKETWITTGVHDFILKIELIQTSNRSNMDLDSHSTGWYVFIGFTVRIGNLHIAPDEMLNVCWMFNVPANILRTLCSSQFWCVDCHTSIFFKTTSTPRGNFRWVLRWIPEKDQLYRWFLYVLCFIWSFPNTTVAVGFHLRWTPFYFKGAWLLIKSFIVIMCRQHAIKTLLENWLKTSYLSFITTVTSCFIKFYMGVSKNRGTPKWMLYNGKPY